MSYSVENHVRVYDDKTGTYINIGPDSDSLNFCELRQCDEKGSFTQRIVMVPEQAVLVAKEIIKMFE